MVAFVMALGGKWWSEVIPQLIYDQMFAAPPPVKVSVVRADDDGETSG